MNKNDVFLSVLCTILSSKLRLYSAKSHPKDAGNRICGTLDFKIFRGSMPPDPPRIAHAFGVRPPKIMSLATPLCSLVCTIQYILVYILVLVYIIYYSLYGSGSSLQGKNLTKHPGFFIFSFAPSLYELRKFRGTNAPTIVPTSLRTPGMNPDRGSCSPSLARHSGYHQDN